MGMNIGSKGTVVAISKQYIEGAAKHFSNATPVTFGKGSYTLDQITSNLQKLVDLRSTVDAARATLAEALSAEVAEAPAMIAFQRQLKAFVKATFVGSPAALADFGIVLKARNAPTVETKTVAVAKRAATRGARHTMGPKEKLAVKGNVTGVVVTPVTTPAPTVPVQNGPTAPATSGSPTAAPTQHTS